MNLTKQRPATAPGIEGELDRSQLASRGAHPIPATSR